MLPRFHAPRLDGVLPEATIDGDEARHLVRVLRLGVGDEVAVFDGHGVEYRGRVRALDRHAVHIELLERLPAVPGPLVPLTLVQSILKGDRMDDVVRDATMMGVTAIVPVVSSHVAVKASVLEGPRPAARWRRVVLASAKQSRRATLPEVHEPRAFREWLALPADGERLLFVEPGRDYVAQPFRAAEGARPDVAQPSAPASLHEWLNRPAPAGASLVVGPEGGWAQDEVEAAIAAGCTPVTLGALTLRADAVPVAAIAICRFVFGDM